MQQEVTVKRRGVDVWVEESRAGAAGSTAGDATRARLAATLAPMRRGYVCSGCGYGIAVAGSLPRCPMCGGDAGLHEPHAARDAARRAAARWPADGGAQRRD